jgi:hypothetical protein
MTETAIANLALSLIAGKEMTDLDTDATQQARVCRKWFDAARDEALASHPWNFATKRAKLTLTWTALSGVALADAGASDEIRVTHTTHGLSTGNRIHIQDVEGVSAANGTWYVTVIDVNTFDLDDSVFSGSHTSGTGEWILAPLFGWDYHHTKPADCLRVNKINGMEGNEEDSERYAVEGSKILCDADEVLLNYVFQETTTANWPQEFINAFALVLASYIAQELTGPAGKAAELRAQFERMIGPAAKQKDARQGKGRALQPTYDSALVRARRGFISTQ